MRFVAAIDGEYRVVLTRLSALRWCMQIFGPHTARFDNLYESPDEAKADAETFVRFALKRWGLPAPQSIDWQQKDY